jgi:putative DNA primase/helicase
MTLAAGLGEMNVYSLVDAMCATAEYDKYDARSEDWVRINPPAHVAQILLSRQGKWRFPAIAGIITTPTLRPDGSLLAAPGYDPATKVGRPRG